MEGGDDEPLGRQEAKIFRGLAARINFLSLDCPDLQFPNKQNSREMVIPTRGSWKGMKKTARYLIQRERAIGNSLGRRKGPKESYTRIVTGGDRSGPPFNLRGGLDDRGPLHQDLERNPSGLRAQQRRS